VTVKCRAFPDFIIWLILRKDYVVLFSYLSVLLCISLFILVYQLSGNKPNKSQHIKTNDCSLVLTYHIFF